MLLPMLVGFAWVNIQDQRIRDPRMMALAIVGFLAYGAIAWWLWNRMAHGLGRSPIARALADRLRIRPSLLTILLYLASMGILFVIAGLVYVTIDTAWRR